MPAALPGGGAVEGGYAIASPRATGRTMIVGAVGGLAIAGGLHKTQLAQQSSIAFDWGAWEAGPDVSLWQMTPIVPVGALAAACTTPGNINCRAIEAIASHAVTRCEPIRINCRSCPLNNHSVNKRRQGHHIPRVP
jgi:hypothetical protein